jgi:indole-3-acetate monooxygenase
MTITAPPTITGPTGTASTTPAGAAVVDAVRKMAAELRTLGDRAEVDRRLPTETIELLASANIFNIFVPVERGGLGLGLLDGCAVIEEVSAADAATGWCLLKTSSSNMMGVSFPPELAATMWQGPADTAAGSLNPKGRAVRVDGGYRVTGRWDWGTASSFSAWLMGGAMVFEEGAESPSMGPFGPEMRVLFFPRDSAELIDTWDTYGMRGTGSGDFAVTDLFVPDEHAMMPGLPQTDYDLHRVPAMMWMMVPHASVALGIARSAIESLLELAAVKTPLGSSTRLADKEWVQDAVARAAAMVAGARAYIEKSVGEAYAAPMPDPSMATQLSLASTHATHTCVEAVDLMQRAAGGSAVYSSNRVQRAFRDLHVAASHYLVNVEKYAAAGRSIITPGAPIIGPAR